MPTRHKKYTEKIYTLYTSFRTPLCKDEEINKSLLNVWSPFNRIYILKWI